MGYVQIVYDNKNPPFFNCYFTEHTFASLPATVRGFPIVVNGDPKGKNFLYCNGNYVYIREIEVCFIKEIIVFLHFCLVRSSKDWMLLTLI